MCLVFSEVEVAGLQYVGANWPLARIVWHVVDDLCAGLYQPDRATGRTRYGAAAPDD